MTEISEEAPDDAQLNAISKAVSAGTPVDWAAEECRAGTAEARATIRELRVIAGVSALHRSLPAIESADPSAEGRRGVEQGAPMWGPLRLLEQIGRGSFGDVFRAWDTRLDREVALKLLRAHPAGGSGVASIVLGEGRLLARVRHPNVVTVHGADCVDGVVGLWMEFIHGCTLEELLLQQGPLSAPEALAVGLDVCRALSVVHHAGMLHRDIKSQNVMREAGGRLVLMDFGTGREISEGSSSRGTEISGTPLYLAPELFVGRPATVQSDLYSVGVLLYHLVSGSYPVQGTSFAELADAHARGVRKLLRDARPELPAAFLDVVERALEPDPEKRFTSTGALERALAKVMIGVHAAGAHRTALEVPSSMHGPRWRRGRKFKVVAAAACIVTAALGYAVALKVSGTKHMFGTAARNLSSGPPDARSPAPDLQTRRIRLPDAMYTGRPSPDGRLLSYVTLEGNLALFDLESGETRRLTNKGDSAESAESQMAISPDSRWLAYTWAALDGAFELRVIQTDGKSPRVLLRRNDVDFPMPVAWSGDGSHLLVVLEMKRKDIEIALVSLDSGRVDVIRSLRAPVPRQVSLSPDGAFVVYDHPATAESADRDIFIARVSDGHEERLVTHPANDLFPFWSAAGDEIIFSSDRAGSLGLWALPVSSGRAAGGPVALHRDLGRFYPLGLTEAGTLYYMLQTGMVDVYTAPLVSPRSDRVGIPEAVSSTFVGSNNSSSWSPDARFLAYVSVRGAVDTDPFSRVLAIRNVVDGTERLLHPPLAFFIAPRWSHDSRTILVRGTDLDGRAGSFLVDAVTGAVHGTMLATSVRGQTAVGNVAWSPGGDRLWFDRPGVGLFERATVGGTPKKILDYAAEGLASIVPQPEGFRVSPNGRALAFYGTDKNTGPGVTVLKVKFFEDPSRELVRLTRPDVFTSLAWAADGTGLLYSRRANQSATSLWWISTGGGEPRQAGLTLNGLRGLDVRSDGRALTFTAGAPKYELWKMDNLLSRPPAPNPEPQTRNPEP
ncbi:MAG: eukaryotic-like serine/threonine-protein kinase [Acidobacteriota bacterium]|jgi:serine/threonine-protein kinase